MTPQSLPKGSLPVCRVPHTRGVMGRKPAGRLHSAAKGQPEEAAHDEGNLGQRKGERSKDSAVRGLR